MFDNDDTQSIPVNDPRFQAMLAGLDEIEGASSPTAYSEVLFLIDDMTIRLNIQNEQVYYLGRFKQSSEYELDLTPYGALPKGVSRIHAKLTMQDSILYIEDLNSSNGTYVRRQRLQPNEPTVLHLGDDLLLARMKMKVSFR